MKILIWFDMEGVSGIDKEEMCQRGDPGHEKGKELATKDVNAVIRGLKRGGATKIDILDGHSSGKNLIAEKIDEFATYLKGGWEDTLYELINTEKIAEYDAVALIGHHSRAGTEEGFDAHTFVPGMKLKYNDQPIGEVELAAWLVGHFSVKTILVTGDYAVVEEAKKYLLGIENVVVKRKIGDEVECYDLQETYEKLEETAFRAIRKIEQIEPYALLNEPIKVDIQYGQLESAGYMAHFPGYKKVDELTARYYAKDGLEAFKAFTACSIILELTRVNVFRQMINKLAKQGVDINLIRKVQKEAMEEAEQKKVEPSTE